MKWFFSFGVSIRFGPHGWGRDLLYALRCGVLLLVVGSYGLSAQLPTLGDQAPSEAVETMNSQPASRREVDLRLRAAQALRRQMKSVEAEHALREILEQAERIQYTEGRLQALISLGDLLNDLRRCQESEAVYRQIQLLAQEVGDKSRALLARVFVLGGKVCSEEYPAAISGLKSLLEEIPVAEIGARYHVQSLLSLAYIRLGFLKEARHYWLQAKKIAQRDERRGLEAELEMQWQLVTPRERGFPLPSELSGRLSSEVWDLLSRTLKFIHSDSYWVRGEIDELSSLIVEWQRVGNVEMEVNLRLLRVAGLRQQGYKVLERAEFLRTYELYREVTASGSHRFPAKLEVMLAALRSYYVGTDEELLSAIAIGMESIEDAEADLRAAPYIQQFWSMPENSLFHQAAAVVAAMRGQVPESLVYAERIRSRAWLQELRSWQDGALEVDRPFMQLLEHSRQRVSDAGAKVSGWDSGGSSEWQQEWNLARLEHAALWLEASERLEDSAGRESEVVLSQLTRQVPSGAALVIYFLACCDSPLLIWVVQQESVEVHLVHTSGAELRQLVGFLNNTIQAGAVSLEVSEDLHELIWVPVQQTLRASQVIIVPHGPLHNLPFAALRDPASGRFLIEDHSLSQVPSLGVLSFLQSQKTSDLGRIAVLGDPRDDLPAAREEARSVARVYHAEPFIGPAATEELLRRQAGRVDTLHLAVHAGYLAQLPLFSRLELAVSQPVRTTGEEDGWLEMHEILSMDWHGTDLVVLSACDSALGEQTGGDELFSLSRAFLTVGVPAVVSTLWKIDDPASAFLMQRFHSYLAMKERPTYAEALRQAQLETLRDPRWHQPYFWAGFQLHGDGSGPLRPGTTCLTEH